LTEEYIKEFDNNRKIEKKSNLRCLGHLTFAVAEIYSILNVIS